MPSSTMYSSNSGQTLRKPPVLRFRAEAQHVFDARSVVPAAVEDHDLAGGRRVLEKALHIELGLLAVGRRRQRHHAEHAMADALGDRLDHAALAGGVASFEDHDYPRTVFLDPILQGAQLDLQLAQRLFVLLTFQASIGSCHRFPFLLAEQETVPQSVRSPSTSSGRTDKYLNCDQAIPFVVRFSNHEQPLRHNLSRPCFHRGYGTPQGAGRTDNHLLRLHDQEENQAAQEEPWPDPERDRFVVE